VSQNLADLERILSNAIAGMSAEDFARRRPNKWNTAEILEHLNLTYLGTIKNFERRLAAGKAAESGERRSRRWQRRLVLWLGIFPPGRKSPEAAVPRGAPTEKLTSEIFENLARMDSLISECDARFGKGKPIAIHPILGPLSAREWRKFHLAHGKHHARQIVKLKKQL
jgi:hypothetical protein